MGAAEQWLADFERALRALEDAPLSKLFRPDAHWRDLLALTWQVKTVSGAGTILPELKRRAAGASGFEIDPGRTPPRSVVRAGESAIEAIFRFKTGRGPCAGVLRLAPDGRCWTLLTALEELESAGRKPGDPAVLIVGGGHAGLSIAARLKALGIDTVIVDRHARAGDNWRKRYHALT